MVENIVESSPGTVKAKKRNKPKRSILLRLLVSFIVLILVVLSTLPIGIKIVAEKWLLENGATTASIRDIDLNVFTGQIRLLNLEAADAEGRHLDFSWVKIGFDWKLLADKKVVIDHIDISNVQLDIDRSEEQIYIGPLSFPLSKPEVVDSAEPEQAATEPRELLATLPWGIGLRLLELNKIKLNYVDANLDQTLFIKKVQIQDVQTWDANKALVVLAEFGIDKSEFNLDSKVWAFASPLKVISDIQIARLDLSPYEVFLSEAGVKKFSGLFSLQAHINATQSKNGDLVAASDSELHLEKLRVVHAAPRANQEQVLEENRIELADIVWKGKTTTAVRPAQEEVIANADGILKLKGLGVETPSHEAKLGQFLWQGGTSFKKSNEQAGEQIELQANTSVNSLVLNQLDPPLNVLDAGSISIEKLLLQGTDKISLAKLTTKNIKVLTTPSNIEPRSKSVLTLKHVKVEQLLMQQLNNLEIDNIVIADVGAWVAKTPQGELEIVRMMNQPEETPQESAENKDSDAAETSVDNVGKTDKKVAMKESTKDAPSAEPFMVAINQFSLVGDNQVIFEDATITPAFEEEFKDLKLELGPINSADSDTPSQLDFSGKIGKYSSLDANGKVWIFREPVDVDMLVKLAGVELAKVSGYSEQAVGMGVEQGRLYLTTDAKIMGGQLDIANTLLMKKIRVTTKNSEKTKSFEQTLAMPIDMALDILRDKKDNIDLKLPVKGSLDDPKFNINDVINKAIAKAMQKYAMHYLTNALQPLGTILLIKDVAEFATKLRFDPLVFANGSVQLDKNSQAYLEKVSSILQDRPNIHITICGRASLGDKQFLIEKKQQELDKKTEKQQAKTDNKKSEGEQPQGEQKVMPEVSLDELIALAEKRSDFVKDYFVNDKRIGEERLFICQPLVDKDEDGQGRVDMSL